MAKNYFVVIDTTILIKYVTQGEKGFEPEHWQHLEKLIAGSEVTLLLPEIVRFEYQKEWRKIKKKAEKQIDELHAHVANKTLWNEIQDIGFELLTHLVSLKDKKLDGIEERNAAVQPLLQHDKAKHLAYDQETWFRAKKRILEGRVIHPDGSPEADCCILEAVIKHFKENPSDEAQLLFCCSNLRDFAGPEIEKGRYALHNALQEGMPPTELFSTLESLTAFVKEQKEIAEPAPQEVAQPTESAEIRPKLLKFPIEYELQDPYRRNYVFLMNEVPTFVTTLFEAADKFIETFKKETRVDPSVEPVIRLGSHALQDLVTRIRAFYPSPIGRLVSELVLEASLQTFADHAAELRNLIHNLPSPALVSRWTGEQKTEFIIKYEKSFIEMALLLGELKEAFA